MNSIRISDHRGKKHLSYKYNIENGIKVARWYKDDKGFWRYNCPNNKEDIVDFCESLSATHQLKLDVTIY